MGFLRLYLVTYDIRDRKRWRRVFKLMKIKGEHSQLSVFLVRADTARIRQLTIQLKEIVDLDEDIIMIAPIDEQASNPLTFLGKTELLIGAQTVVI